MYFCHIIVRYFEGNKNDSLSSEQICAPLILLKYSLITVFYAKVIEECCSKMDEVPTLANFFCSPLSCHSFRPLIAFILTPSPGLLLSFLMSYTCQPSGHGTSVTKSNVPVLHPMLFPLGIDHSFLLTVHNPNPPVQTTLSGSPFICLFASSL